MTRRVKLTLNGRDVALALGQPLDRTGDRPQPEDPEHRQPVLGTRRCRDTPGRAIGSRSQLARGCRPVDQGVWQRPPTSVCHCPRNSLHPEDRITAVT